MNEIEKKFENKSLIEQRKILINLTAEGETKFGDLWILQKLYLDASFLDKFGVQVDLDILDGYLINMINKVTTSEDDYLNDIEKGFIYGNNNCNYGNYLLQYFQGKSGGGDYYVNAVGDKFKDLQGYYENLGCILSYAKNNGYIVKTCRNGLYNLKKVS